MARAELIPGLYIMKAVGGTGMVTQGGTQFLRIDVHWIGTDRYEVWWLAPKAQAWGDLGLPPVTGVTWDPSRILDLVVGRVFVFETDTQFYRGIGRARIKEVIAEVVDA